MKQILRLPIEDYYVQVVADGNIVLHGDLEISTINRGINKDLIQVYKRRHKTKNKKGDTVFQEYNRLHYNSLDAVRDFLRMKAEN